jgi:hypothetical protein
VREKSSHFPTHIVREKSSHFPTHHVDAAAWQQNGRYRRAQRIISRLFLAGMNERTRVPVAGPFCASQVNRFFLSSNCSNVTRPQNLHSSLEDQQEIV